MEAVKNSNTSGNLFNRHLAEMDRLLRGVREDIHKKTAKKPEVVFLPWRAENWDSMESIWKAAKEDSAFDVSVIPLPWYYRDEEGSVKEQVQYDAEAFPDYVEIIDYREYSLPLHHPEMIIINNPYDQCNYTTVIDPFFWAKQLKGWTEHLVYVPWFVTDEIDIEQSPEDPAVYNMRYYVTVPGVVHSDLVVVQSELMRTAYIKALTDMSGEEYAEVWNKKVCAFGSPLREERNPGEGYEAIPVSPIWEQIKGRIREEETAREDNNGNQ